MTQASLIASIRSEATNASAQINSGHQLYSTISPLIDSLANNGVFLADLPTSDPHVNGQLWNSTGTPTVSTG